MAIDLTSSHEALHDFIHPELTNCTISVELKFDAPLGENVEVHFTGERASRVYLRSDRKIAKNNVLNREKMDNLQVIEFTNRCKTLKQNFRAIFSANLAFNTILKRDKTFMIVNASNSDQPGPHWLLFAQAGGQIFCFADLLAKPTQVSIYVLKK